jgi:hypothetical protein
LVISGGFTMLVRPHGCAEAVDKFRGSVASVAEHAHEPVNAEEVFLGAARLGDPIGVKQQSVALFKLHGGFFERL